MLRRSSRIEKLNAKTHSAKSATVSCKSPVGVADEVLPLLVRDAGVFELGRRISAGDTAPFEHDIFVIQKLIVNSPSAAYSKFEMVANEVSPSKCRPNWLMYAFLSLQVASSSTRIRGVLSP